jgi:Protein of unknown function (DUF3010)
MKIIAIDISSTEALFCFLESGKELEFKKIGINSDEKSDELKRFYEDTKNIFFNFQPNLVAISKRGNKGKFAASSVSFKLESIIQIASENNVEIISTQTVAAYTKKNPNTTQVKYNYQQKAADLANYMSTKK